MKVYIRSEADLEGQASALESANFLVLFFYREFFYSSPTHVFADPLLWWNVRCFVVFPGFLHKMLDKLIGFILRVLEYSYNRRIIICCCLPVLYELFKKFSDLKSFILWFFREKYIQQMKGLLYILFSKHFPLLHSSFFTYN